MRCTYKVVRITPESDIAQHGGNVRLCQKQTYALQHWHHARAPKMHRRLIVDWGCALDVKQVVQTSWTDGQRTDP